MTEREQLEADVLIVGGGPSGLACALHLANLIERHTEAKKSPALSAENVYVLEKAREIGAHQLSGAILDPRPLRELLPDFEKTAPLDTPVTGDAAYYFTEGGSWKLPITPAAPAQSWEFMLSFAQPDREMAWRACGAEGRERLHAVRRAGSDIRKEWHRGRGHRRQGRGQGRQAEK